MVREVEVQQSWLFEMIVSEPTILQDYERVSKGSSHTKVCAKGPSG